MGEQDKATVPARGHLDHVLPALVGATPADGPGIAGCGGRRGQYRDVDDQGGRREDAPHWRESSSHRRTPRPVRAGRVAQFWFDASLSAGEENVARRSRPPGLLPVLEGHVVGAEQLVAPRLPGYPLVGAVEVDLLVERNGRHLLDPQLVDAVVLGEALLLVHLRLRFLDHAVEVVVVPVDEDVGRLEERHVDRLGVHGGMAPADEPHRSRLVYVHHVVQVAHELVGAQRRLDPRLRELAGHGLRHLAITHVASLRAVQHDLEAVWKAGIGQELLGLGQILLQGLERGVVAEVQARQHGRYAYGLAVHHALDDLVGIDRVGQSLAHALVGGRTVVGARRLVIGIHLMRVDHELDRPDGRRRAKEDLRVPLDDPGEVRGDVHRDVDLAVLQRGAPHRVVWDRLEDHRLDPGRPTPVAGEGLHHDLLVLGPAHELVGPGADGILRDRRRVLARIFLRRIHGDLAQGNVAQEDGPRLLGVDLHGVGVDDLHPVDRRERRRATELVRRVDEALDAELHGLCGEVFAVVELDALAELDLPGGGRHQLRHLRGERRHELEALVALEQRLEYLGAHVRGRLLLLVRHVEGLRVHALRDHHLALGSRRDGYGTKNDAEQDDLDAPRAHGVRLRSRRVHFSLRAATLWASDC